MTASTLAPFATAASTRFTSSSRAALKIATSARAFCSAAFFAAEAAFSSSVGPFFLPPMVHGRSGHGLIAVGGGVLAVGGGVNLQVLPAELFDEASGRWFELPHLMVEPRRDTCVVSLPAAALAQPAAAAAAP